MTPDYEVANHLSPYPEPSVPIRATRRIDSDTPDYEAAKSALMEKHINDRDSQNNLILTFFGYDSEGKAIYAVLPEDIPTCRVCHPST